MPNPLARFGSVFVYACVAAVFVLAAAAPAHAQQTVTATWDRNTDAHTVGYRLYYGTTSGSYQWSVDVGNVNTAPLTLSPGSYYFAVRAYNASNQYGPSSNEATFTVGGGPSPPPPPTAAIQATLVSANSARVTWQTTNATSATINGTAVATSGTQTVTVNATTTFTLVARNASGATATAAATVTIAAPAPTAAIQATLVSANSARVSWQTTNATSATINGTAVATSGTQTVTVSATTTFALVARNASGATATASATVTIGSQTPTAAIQATLVSANSARVTWQTTNATSATINGTAVATSGTQTVTVNATTTFRLVARSSSGATATASATVTVSAPAPTAAIQAQLVSANSARVTWQTTNATSATINGTTVATSGTQTVTVNATTTFRLVARNASGATATASATVTIGGNPPTAAIQATLESANSARVTWQTTNAVSVTINGAAVDPNGTQTVTVTGPTTFTLLARSANGETASANATVTPRSTGGRPLPPVGVEASVSGSTVTLKWQPNPSGGAPTGYLVSVGTTPSSSNVISGASLGNVLSVSAPMPRGTYYVRLRARNAAGVSASSNTVSFRIGRRLPSPTGLAATWSGTRTTLSWIEPGADSPELEPTDYVLEAGTAPGLADVAVLRVGRTNRFSVDVPHGVYYVRVRAINDGGDSDPTADVVVAAPGTAAAPQVLTSSGDGAAVALSWAAPSGPEPPVGYLIEAGSDPGLSDLATLRVGNVTSFTTEAPPGTYFVRVRAINSRGPGLPSNEVIVQK